MDACKPPKEADMARLSESGAPDLRAYWRESDAPAGVRRHIRLLDMLFQPNTVSDGDILPPNG